MSDPIDNRVSRRDFIKSVTMGIGALIGTALGLPSIAYLLAPALRTVEDEAWVSLGALEDYTYGIPTLFEFVRTKINGWEKTAMSYGVFVIRQDEKKVRVFSNICTHLACRVSWHADIENYVSPCHDGHFDIVGNVISGPPPRPLDEFQTKIEDGILYAMLPPYRRSA